MMIEGVNVPIYCDNRDRCFPGRIRIPVNCRYSIAFARARETLWFGSCNNSQ